MAIQVAEMMDKRKHVHQIGGSVPVAVHLSPMLRHR